MHSTNTQKNFDYAKLSKYLPDSVVVVAHTGLASSKKGFEHWTAFDLAFDEYLAAGAAGCVVVANEIADIQGVINSKMARLVLCAMYKKRPIVLLHTLSLNGDVGDVEAEIIRERNDKLYVANLRALASKDKIALLEELCHKTIDYKLTKSQLLAIEGIVQSHLHSLR